MSTPMKFYNKLASFFGVDPKDDDAVCDFLEGDWHLQPRQVHEVGLELALICTSEDLIEEMPWEELERAIREGQK